MARQSALAGPKEPTLLEMANKNMPCTILVKVNADGTPVIAGEYVIKEGVQDGYTYAIYELNTIKKVKREVTLIFDDVK